MCVLLNTQTNSQINSINNATGILTTEIQLNVIVLQDLPSYV